MCLRAPSSWEAAQLPPAESGDGFPLVPLLLVDYKDSTSSSGHSGPCLLCRLGSVLQSFILQPSGHFEHSSYLSTLALRTTCHRIIEMETKKPFTFGLQFPRNHHRLTDSQRDYGGWGQVWNDVNGFADRRQTELCDNS